MRRAIVHIGMPRTGSTTFQSVLFRLGPELAKVGILYPDLTPRSAADHPHLNHQHFGEALDGRRPRREARELLQLLSRELACTKADVVLISYEDFIQEKQAARISNTLRSVFDQHGFQMEAVVAVKPQSEHLNSVYSHRMQMMSEKRRFSEFATAYMTSGRFAYHKLAEPWLAACSGRVRGVPTRDMRSAAPLVRRMLVEMGLDNRVGPLLVEDDLARVENRSPGPVTVEVSRRLRHMRVQARIPTRAREMVTFVDHLVRDRGFDQVPFKGVGPDLGAHMSRLFQDTNDQFALAVWAQPWSAVVAPEPAYPVSEIAGRPIPPELETLVSGIIREACRQFNVVPIRPRTSGLAELLADTGGWLGQSLRISKWRVL